MRILLVRPPFTPYIESSRTSEAADKDFLEPLALEVLASVVPEHDVEILDMEVENIVEERLNDFQPDVVGVTCFGVATIYDTQDVLKRIREKSPNVFIVLGGIGSSTLPEEFNSDNIDVMVMGEGEITFREIIDSIQEGRDYKSIHGIAFREEGKFVFTKPRPFIQNLDDLPLPNRTLCKKYLAHYNHFLYAASTQFCFTTRGCESQCTFCAGWKQFGGCVRYQSAERVIREIEEMEAPYIDFLDDNFIHNEKRADKIADLIIEKGIKKRGFHICARADDTCRTPYLIEKWRSLADSLFVTIGLESIEDKYLKEFGKSTTGKQNDEAIKILGENDVFFVGMFMAHPMFDKDDFKRLADYVEERPEIPFPVFLVYTPAPGAEAFQKEEKRLITRNWQMFEGTHAVIPTRLPLEEFYQHYDALCDITRERAIHFLTSKMALEEIDIDFLERFVNTHVRKKRELISLE